VRSEELLRELWIQAPDGTEDLEEVKLTRRRESYVVDGRADRLIGPSDNPSHEIPNERRGLFAWKEMAPVVHEP
jgi:hypothetical protein